MGWKLLHGSQMILGYKSIQQLHKQNILGVPHTLVADAGGTDCTLSKGLPYMGSAFFSSIVIWNCMSALLICRIRQGDTAQHLLDIFHIQSLVTSGCAAWTLASSSRSITWSTVYAGCTSGSSATTSCRTTHRSCLRLWGGWYIAWGEGRCTWTGWWNWSSASFGSW